MCGSEKEHSIRSLFLAGQFEANDILAASKDGASKDSSIEHSEFLIHFTLSSRNMKTFRHFNKVISVTFFVLLKYVCRALCYKMSNTYFKGLLSHGQSSFLGGHSA